MTLPDRLASSEQRALTLACEAFSDATHLYHATPLSASGRKGQADARMSTNDGPDAWIRFDVAGKQIVPGRSRIGLGRERAQKRQGGGEKLGRSHRTVRKLGGQCDQVCGGPGGGPMSMER